MSNWRGAWIGTAVAVAATLLLTVVAASLESTVNAPGTRSIAAPVLWAFGGGAGLALGGFVGSFLTRRFWPGLVAVVLGAVALLVLVVIAYNSSDLRAEDQIVGTLIVVVLPGFAVSLGVTALGMFTGRLFGRRQPAAH
jgi:hypothetical protein